MEPRLKHLWTKAGTPMNRTELDSRNSSTAEDPFAQIAEAFNDYKTYVYQNPVIKYDAEGKPLNPMQPATSREALAANCWDIDPNCSGRPTRDAAWVKKTWGEMRSKLTSIRQKYKASGNQDADDPDAEWPPPPPPLLVLYPRV